jgi:hypothetical protein
LNFYKNESTEGYVKLKKGQEYLFDPSNDWNQVGRFTSNGSKTECPISYANQAVNFTIPASSFNVNSVYSFELINVPKSQTGKVDRNVSDTSNKVDTDNASVDVEIKSRDVKGSIDELQEKSLYTSFFRTSSFLSISDKLNSLTLLKGTWFVDYSMTEFDFWYRGNELFDKYETGPISNNAGSFVQFEAVLETDNWYQNKIKPLVYDNYPIENVLSIKHRATGILGVPPTRAIAFLVQQNDKTLSDPSRANFDLSTTSIIANNIPLESYLDYKDLVAQAALNSLRTSRINYLLTAPFTLYTRGTIRMKIKYVMPGTNKITFEKIFDVTYD